MTSTEWLSRYIQIDSTKQVIRKNHNNGNDVMKSIYHESGHTKTKTKGSIHLTQVP